MPAAACMAYYRQLVALCVKALSTFDSSATIVEDHIDRFLKSAECQVWHGTYDRMPCTRLTTQTMEGVGEQTFLQEVVAGCVRHKQFIKVVWGIPWVLVVLGIVLVYIVVKLWKL